MCRCLYGGHCRHRTPRRGICLVPDVISSGISVLEENGQLKSQQIQLTGDDEFFSNEQAGRRRPCRASLLKCAPLWRNSP